MARRNEPAGPFFLGDRFGLKKRATHSERVGPHRQECVCHCYCTGRNACATAIYCGFAAGGSPGLGAGSAGETALAAMGLEESEP